MPEINFDYKTIKMTHYSNGEVIGGEKSMKQKRIHHGQYEKLPG